MISFAQKAASMTLPFVLAASGANAGGSPPRGLEQMPPGHTVLSSKVVEGGKLDFATGKRIKDGTQRLDVVTGPAELKGATDAAHMQYIGSLLRFKETGKTGIPAPINVVNKAFPDSHACHEINITPLNPDLVKAGTEFYTKHGNPGVKELKKSIDMGAYMSAGTYGLAPVEKNDPQACPLTRAP
jgi:hypothetical protein